ncbi:two-pore potassium channel 1-like [Cynara cardunculus var. scolymus]|uniref:two-pore potassium channel 1-like n=1 Tax=Cynara cardunculus var. scolymus TaxID=59895 RepID=UPI000D623327|nr:two-pore potassium channel 1-like [Cynara cardunculus var. scolymus]
MVCNCRNQASSTRPPKCCDSKRVTDTKYGLFIVIFCLIYISVATISFYGVRDHIRGKKTNDFLDAIYFTIVLMTSAGYKDLQPHRTLAILLATFYALVGIVVFGVLMSLGADNILATQMGKREFLASVLDNKTVQYPSGLKIKWKVLTVMLAVHLFFGTPLLIFVGEMHFFRALYCVSSTFTTVLSDEKCFSTKGRRFFAVFWILFGVFVLSGMIYIITETYHHRRKWLVGKKDDKLVDMLPSDLDDDGFITELGFLKYKGRRAKRLHLEGKLVDVKEPGRLIMTRDVIYICLFRLFVC